MLYVKSRNSFKVRRQKKFITLLCAKKKHTANHDFAVCQKKTHGKPWLCRVLWFCRVFSWAHLAKIMFAVCPWICTRQTMVHTAKSKFPVVAQCDQLFLHLVLWLEHCIRCGTFSFVAFVPDFVSTCTRRFRWLIEYLFAGIETSTQVSVGHGGSI